MINRASVSFIEKKRYPELETLAYTKLLTIQRRQWGRLINLSGTCITSASLGWVISKRRINIPYCRSVKLIYILRKDRKGDN